MAEPPNLVKVGVRVRVMVMVMTRVRVRVRIRIRVRVRVRVGVGVGVGVRVRVREETDGSSVRSRPTIVKCSPPHAPGETKKERELTGADVGGTHTPCAPRTDPEEGNGRVRSRRILTRMGALREVGDPIILARQEYASLLSSPTGCAG